MTPSHQSTLLEDDQKTHRNQDDLDAYHVGTGNTPRQREYRNRSYLTSEKGADEAPRYKSNIAGDSPSPKCFGEGLLDRMHQSHYPDGYSYNQPGNICRYGRKSDQLRL